MPRKLNIGLKDIGTIRNKQVVVEDDGSYLSGKEARAAQAAAGFEASIPRCAICTHRVYAVRALNNGKQDASKVTLGCTLLKIRVTGTSVCDKWSGNDGSILV